MPKSVNNLVMANWIANFNNRNPKPPIPPDPCKPCSCNTASTVECKCNIENILQLQFANHAWLTILTINLFFTSPTTNSGQINASATALGATPANITNAIQPFTDASNCPPILAALNSHVALAGQFINALKNGSATDASNAQVNFYNEASQLATAFTALNPCMLTYDMMLSMWQYHNEYVINIAYAVYGGNYTTDITESLEYFYENDKMAIEIADAVAELYCCQGC